MNDKNHIDKAHMDQRVLDLLNAGIDGELSPSEEAELNVYLADSEQVRDLNEELISMVNLLEQVPELEPPQYLQSTIDSTLGDITKNYNQSVKPAMSTAQARSGSFGNSGLQQIQAGQEQNLAQELGRASSNLRFGDYFLVFQTIGYWLMALIPYALYQVFERRIPESGRDKVLE